MPPCNWMFCALTPYAASVATSFAIGATTANSGSPAAASRIAYHAVDVAASTATARSATRWRNAWNVASVTPNCSRAVRCPTAIARPAVASPTDSTANAAYTRSTTCPGSTSIRVAGAARNSSRACRRVMSNVGTGVRTASSPRTAKIPTHPPPSPPPAPDGKTSVDDLFLNPIHLVHVAHARRGFTRAAGLSPARLGDGEVGDGVPGRDPGNSFAPASAPVSPAATVTVERSGAGAQHPARPSSSTTAHLDQGRAEPVLCGSIATPSRPVCLVSDVHSAA